MIKKTFYIEGMHCVSCEKLLHDEFSNIPGVKDAVINRKTETAEISYIEKEVPDFSEIKNVAAKFGYGMYEEKSKKLSKKNWKEWVWAIIIVTVLYFVFRYFERSNNLSVGIEDLRTSLFLALLIGLVASISSCLAVVGSVVIAFSEKYISSGQNAFGRILKPNLLFHLGRLSSFFLLGGLLGLIGGKINISGNFIFVYSIIIAIVMTWLGLNILGFVPSITELGMKYPKSLVGHWDRLRFSNHKFAPVILGALSFFLPCGFTQSMQIFALASGSFWAGAASMFLFALGTFPMLLFLGVTASFTKDRGMAVTKKVAGLLVIIFAMFTLNSGLTLAGVRTNVISSDSTKTDTSVKTKVSQNSNTNDSNIQIVEMHVTSSGFSPQVLKIKKGKPVEWIIYGDQVSSCTNKIIIPSLNITKDISRGKNIISFTPDKTGEIPFSCWMGMVRGKFIIE